MILPAPILLIVVIILCQKSKEYITDIKLKKLFKTSIGIITLSTILCLLFGTLGYLYIQHYQDTNNSCPSQYPYAWATLASGFLGVVTFIYITVKLFKQKITNAGLMMAASTILFILLVLSASLASFFCLTF
jgi:hypothetical protein